MNNLHSHLIVPNNLLIIYADKEKNQTHEQVSTFVNKKVEEYTSQGYILVNTIRNGAMYLDEYREQKNTGNKHIIHAIVDDTTNTVDKLGLCSIADLIAHNNDFLAIVEYRGQLSPLDIQTHETDDILSILFSKENVSEIDLTGAQYLDNQ